MKTGFGLLFFTLLFINSFSQGISNQWIFGYQGGGGHILLDFDSSIVQVDTFPANISFKEANSSICDKNGNLLFFTNGICIGNKLLDTMQNGGGLGPGKFANTWKLWGSPLSQAALIIPFPADSNKYYLFHVTATEKNNGDLLPPHQLLETIVDMSLDSGRGAVTLKNYTVLSDTIMYGKITACKHANGRDWWVICHRTRSTQFYKLLITPQGILGPFAQNIGSPFYEGIFGQTVFSPDGTHYAYYNLQDGIHILDFDRCTGDFYNPRHFTTLDSGFISSVAISPNSRYLYASNFLRVYQFDLQAANIQGSMDTVAVYDGFSSPQPPFYTQFYLAQLAADGKIYLSSPGGVKHLHVINYPDSANNACGFVQHSLFLKAYNAGSIPNLPNYFLGPLSGSICDTLNMGNQETVVKQLNLRIAPNPVQDILYIKYTPQSTSLTLKIYDMNGKKVQHSKLPPWSQIQSFDVSNFKDGIYQVKISSNKELGSIKFLKIKE
ncbi:MAG: T9SS type A sorting domain-containing protein [Bacteroidetes bacterium]|nr:T9SS type A sorting domain-containing protein [Bacteroidota bacterium]MBP6411833.1 T9SS type A sorting domain-containing protein [Bacteroidia bacterium]